MTISDLIPRQREPLQATSQPSRLARRMVSAAEAERILGIPAATVRQWAKRERIFSVGLDKSGRPLYDLEDLRRHAEKVA